MNIQQIVMNYSAEVAQLFATYGINTPVNMKSVSSAILVYSTPQGNVFLEDLSSLIGEELSGYDSLFGFGKGGKARRQEKRAARGGYSRLGSVLRKVGIAKNRPAKGQEVASNVDAVESPLENQAHEAEHKPDGPGGKIAEREPGKKITGQNILNGVMSLGSAALDIYKDVKGGGDQNTTENNTLVDDRLNEDPKQGFDMKKYLPWIIGGAVLVVGVIIFFATKKK